MTNMQATDNLNQVDVPRSVVRNTLVQLTGRVIAGLLALAALMTLTRYLGVEGVGDFLLVLSLLALLNISDMGIYTITVRELSSGESRAEVLLGNVLLIRIVSAVLAMALLSLVALLLSYPAEVTIAIWLASLSYLFMAVGRSSLGATFAANLRMEFQALATTVQSLTFIGLVGLIVSQGMGLIALVLAYDASILANTAVVIFFSKKFVVPRFRLDLHVCRALLTASLPVALASMAWMAYSRIDMVMLSKMKGAEAVGLYGLAYRFIELSGPLGFLFIISVYPILSRYYRLGDGERLRRLLQESLDFLSLLVIGLATAVIVFAEPIISFIASDEFLPAATSLRILSLAVVFIWVGGLTYHTLFAVGKQGALLWATLLGLVVNVGLNLVLIPRFSFDGAAAATVVTELVVFLLALIVLARHLDYLPSFGVAAKTVPVALAAGAAALFLAPGGLVLQGAAMVSIFGIGLVLVRVVSIDEMRALGSASMRRDVA